MFVKQVQYTFNKCTLQCIKKTFVITRALPEVTLKHYINYMYIPIMMLNIDHCVETKMMIAIRH